MQTELVKRTCDFCGTSEVYPKDGQTTPAIEKSLESWITMARVFLVNNQQMPIVRHACKDSCAANILSTHMMELPQEVKDAANRPAN